MTRMAWFAELRYCARHPAARAGMWACALAMLATVAASAYWWPAQQSHDRLDAEIAAKRRELVQAQQADELIRMYTRAEKDVPILEQKLEQAVSQAQLVQNLGRLTHKQRVRIVSETYTEAKRDTGDSSLVSELTVEGGYVALRNFLGELPSLPTWSEVQDVRLEAARGSQVVKGRIRIVTHRRASAS